MEHDIIQKANGQDHSFGVPRRGAAAVPAAPRECRIPWRGHFVGEQGEAAGTSTQAARPEGVFESAHQEDLKYKKGTERLKHSEAEASRSGPSENQSRN